MEHVVHVLRQVDQYNIVSPVAQDQRKYQRNHWYTGEDRFPGHRLHFLVSFQLPNFLLQIGLFRIGDKRMIGGMAADKRRLDIDKNVISVRKFTATAGHHHSQILSSQKCRSHRMRRSPHANFWTHATKGRWRSSQQLRRTVIKQIGAKLSLKEI